MSDLVVYVVAAAWIAAAVVARGRPAFTVLCGLSALAWLAVLVLPGAVLWHRGLLIHLLLAGGSWLPTSWIARLVIAAGYVAAFLVWPWGQPWPAAGLALVVVLAAGIERGRHWASPLKARAWRAASALTALAFAASPLLTAAGLARGWAVVVLVAYAVAQLVVVVLLLAVVRPWSVRWATDVAVELGTAPHERLLDALATTLGDPRGVLEQATVALAAADELSSRLAVRHELLTATLGEARESRRRLEAVEVEERRDLRRALEDVAVAQLRHATRRLSALAEAPSAPGEREPVERALRHLGAAIVEMDGLGEGLAPRALTAGLIPALERLGATAPVMVSLDMPDEASVETIPDDVAGCVYFVAAEALANVVKHADAGSVVLRLRRGSDPFRGLVDLTVTDDGRGLSADAGAGLTGLRLRAQDVGGRIEVTSRPGAGTRVRLTVPVPTGVGR